MPAFKGRWALDFDACRGGGVDGIAELGELLI